MPEDHKSGADDWFRYAFALEACEAGFWDWDIVTGQLWASSHFRSIVGLRDACSTLDAWLERVHPRDKSRLTSELGALRLGATSSLSVDHRVRGVDGAWRWVTLRGAAACDSAGAVTRIAGALCDIHDARTTDPLTTLPNRAFFVDQLERRIERGFQHADWNFALLAIALDRFDSLCETLGSSGGEELLIETASRLHALLPESSVAARLIGAEFMILLDGVHTEADAARFAARAAASFCGPLLLRGRTIVPQCAIGIAQAGIHCSHPEEFIADAESALLHARRREPPGIVCYSQGMHERATELVIDRFELEIELRNAIQQGELLLLYQPEVDLRTRQIVGFEALVRWRHPRRGLLSPADFIPIAEESGLIVPLGEWGLAEACRQLVQWRSTGAEPLRRAHMSVNLSARQIEKPDLVAGVQHTLAATGLPPACLRLEVTESGLISDPQAAQRNMRALEKLGVGLHMDDFGTGYSSLDYLQRFPFDTLKIDRSFVRDIAYNHNSRLIVGSIIHLARSLGMDVVAEGIEDAEQLAELKTLGCPCGQGYYFSRPMEPAAIDALVLTQAADSFSAFSAPLTQA
ncbi:MAG TPA: GGDEF and EAL domain-containing protein [Acidobacteriaceae bacterium]|nr:GGDEF and EAL domain-containing protein [Acidobacteriaceae bacterium]